MTWFLRNLLAVAFGVAIRDRRRERAGGARRLPFAVLIFLWLLDVVRVARRVRQAREQLAERCGVSLRGFQMWEQGRRIPRMDGIVALARELGKPVAYFFEPLDQEAA